MLRSTIRTLTACAFIATLTLLSSRASAELPIHPTLQDLRPIPEDIGPDPEAPHDAAFGNAVVIRSELAFIGMPFAYPNGRVAVFAAGATALTRTVTLTQSDPTVTGGFGRLLAYRDGVLAVGATNAVYIFQRVNGVWTQKQKLIAPAADHLRVFPDSLHYEDGTLAIGADARSSAAAGAVYIYQRDAAGKFIARGKLAFSDSALADGFGASISMAGPVIVVGAPGLESAYIFRRNSTGTWRQQQRLTASELEPGTFAEFGTSVAIDRSMILIGAPSVPTDDPSGGLSQHTGAAYGFVAGAGGYIETFKLEPRPDDLETWYAFGRQVAMFDQRIVVEAQFMPVGDGGLNGSIAFTYTRSGSSVLPRGIAAAHFASTSLSLANQRLLIGEPCDIGGGFCPYRGRAQLYNLNVLQ
jgi:hypothetical protein